MTQQDTMQKFQAMLLNGKTEDVLLSQSIKDEIQGMIDFLQKEFDNMIAPPTATEINALEYILLFAIEGNIAATLLGSNMDEYYAAVDVYCDLLNLYGERDEE